MEFVESDDGQPFRRPPALDDRIWRHPSEVGATTATAVRRPRLVPQRTVWVAAIVAAVGASMLTSGFVVALTGDRARTGVTETSATVGGPPSTPVEPVVAVAEKARPAIAEITADTPAGSVTGSGVLISTDGQVITNAHVVQGASAVHVLLSSGQQLDGKLVGTDPMTDVAVVKLDGGPYPVADLGTDIDLKVGQTAVAIGSPLALAGGPSVTAGVVSAMHRSVKTKADSSMADMIQTDAPVSAASSGGALLDASGRVIGITTAFVVGDPSSEALGFATPIDTARSVAEQLMTSGKATHAWMGLDGNDVDGTTARDLNLDGGAIVMTVADGGPASAAGIVAGDIIVAMDSKPIVSMGALGFDLRLHQPGDTVSVEYVHGHDHYTKQIVLTERPPG